MILRHVTQVLNNNIFENMGIYLSPGFKGEDCADLSTSIKFGIHVVQNILNSFCEGAEAVYSGLAFGLIPSCRCETHCIMTQLCTCMFI